MAQKQPAPASMPDKMKMIKDFIETPETKIQFEAVCGKNANGFIVGFLQLVSQNEMLKNADIESLINAAMRAAMLGLSLDKSLQLAHIGPWTEPKTGRVFAQFQIGWRGLVQLGLRTGKFKTINVNDVRDGELLGKNGLTGEYEWSWVQDKELRDTLPVIGYVSYFRLITGFEKTIYWTVAELQEHAKKYSESFNNFEGDWITNFAAMARKTVLKDNLSKWAPVSSDIAVAIESDQAIITGPDSKVEYLDNPNTPEAAEVNKRQGKAEAGMKELKRKLKTS